VFVGGGPAIAAIELFDPSVTGAFAILPAQATARVGAALAAVPDGRALVIGGVDTGGDALPLVEVLDPDPTLPIARQREEHDGPALADHQAVVLVDGTIFVAGGRVQAAPGGVFTVADAAWQFRFGAGGTLDAPRQLAQTLGRARASHSMTRLGDEVGADVLIVGGVGGGGAPVAEAELYRPLREAFEDVDGAVLAVPRWNHRAVRLPGGFVLILGGFAPDPTGGDPIPVAELELYDPIQGRFSPAGTLPAAAGLTDFAATPLPDDRVLLTGGRGADGQPVDAVHIARLDPIDGQVDVSVTDRLAIPRAGHSAVALCDGTVLLLGGTDAAGAAGAERYNPPSAGRR
jgi:hypothetical protein